MQRYIMLFLSFLTLFFCINANAINYPAKPGNADYYVDDANLISPQDRTQINAVSNKLWQEKHVFMLIVTIKSLAAEDANATTVDGYARSLFDFWGIGSQQDNNGILLLVSKDDHRARIEFGDAWAHKYDAQADKIMQTDIIPLFRQQNYSAGILNGATSLAALASGVYVDNKPLPPQQSTPAQKLLAVAGIVLIVVLLISLFRSGRRGWGWGLIAFLGLALWWIVRNNKNGGGGSGGGFGGGSGGGGGSSGSW